MAKQTGPMHGVKKKQPRGNFLSVTLALATTLAIAGCGSTWHHPNRDAAATAADERACAQRAEENALTRAGRQRADYRLGTPAPLPGMSRGETPMEMLDRRATQDDYGRDFEDCMTSRGYTQD